MKKKTPLPLIYVFSCQCNTQITIGLLAGNNQVTTICACKRTHQVWADYDPVKNALDNFHHTVTE
jgi:hypothetical protein